MLFPTPEAGRTLIRAVAKKYGLTEKRLLAKDRNPALKDVRWETMSALRQEGFSLLVIGKLMNRNHTTILHGLRKTVPRAMFEGAGL